ncbi:hypothetical protein T484DRAFT_1839043 [Baffinella frigidus]|nr:hypothetical protein T484DRAFT_1839043 [Cryptophyta sp. CCMP2293]
MNSPSQPGGEMNSPSQLAHQQELVAPLELLHVQSVQLPGRHSQTQLSITGEAAKSPPAKAQDVRGGMGGFTDYFDGKVGKLREQFLVEQAARVCSSSIFASVTVWVDGRTNPPKDEIELLMKDNGGVLAHYFFPDESHEA